MSCADLSLSGKSTEGCITARDVAQMRDDNVALSDHVGEVGGMTSQGGRWMEW